MPIRMNKFYFSTAVTMCLFSYSLLLSLPGSTLLREPDTFWQIRTGQWILEHGTVPVTDFYSFTALDEGGFLANGCLKFCLL
jgi:hypothetical protein